MARLWEDTLVIALRDAQWIKAQQQAQHANSPLPVYPDTFIKHDGNAESRLGDLQYQNGTRFFLLEVKSTEDQIKEEWVSSGRFKPKKAYRKLSALVTQWMSGHPNAHPDIHASLQLRLSLQGHHFVYWSPREKKGGFWQNILIEPYISAAMRLRDAHAPTASQTMKALTPGFWVGQQIGHDLYDAGNTTHLGVIQSEQGYVLALGYHVDESNHHEIGTYWAAQLGLEWDDFQTYVNFLCEESTTGDEEIHAVVLSSDGQLFRVVTRTSELKRIFDSSPVEEYADEPSIALNIQLDERFAPHVERPEDAPFWKSFNPANGSW